MPIVMTMNWKGFTREQYEAIRKPVNWEGNVPKGLRFHAAAFDANGAHVTDIWDTADNFNDFVKTRLMPGVKQVGIQGEPQVEIYPTHNIFTPAYNPK